MPGLRSASLASALSARLALQSLLVLALVSALVYAATDRHLAVGQTGRLDEMRTLVEHLAEEADAGTAPGDLEHVLEDVFAGHADFGLELLDAEGPSASAPRLQAGLVTPDGRSHLAEGHEDVRTVSFALRAGDGREMRARLLLHTRRDDELLFRLALTLGVAVALGTLLNSVAASWRVRRDLAPVGRLAERIDGLDARSLERRLDGADQPLELRPLVARFNDLLDRLSRSYRQMAAFNADVAHELNTPLTTLITSVEVALRGRTDDPDALRELLGSNLEELERLAGIVRDMLFLSTAERGARARTTDVPSLAAEVREVVDYHEAALEEAGVRVEITGDARARVDAGLLRRALSNLIGNATRHAEPGTTIDVHLDRRTARDAGSEIVVTVSNVGETVAEEHLPRLFDRFYRVGRRGGGGVAADPRQSPRHGLGLSIVAAIARMHAGETFARSADGLTSIGLIVPEGLRSRPTASSARGAPDGAKRVAGKAPPCPEGKVSARVR